MRIDGYWSGVGGATVEKAEEIPVYRGPRQGETRRFWSEDEDRLLIRIRCGGIRPATAAEVIGRSYQSVVDRTMKLREAGVIEPTGGDRWTWRTLDGWEDALRAFRAQHRRHGRGEAWDESGDEDLIAGLAEEGLSAKDIAKEMDGKRTPYAIQARLVRLRQEGEVSPVFRPWKGADVNGEPYDHIRQLHEDFYAGYSDEVIAKRLQRSAGAVLKKRQELGLKRNFRGMPTWG